MSSPTASRTGRDDFLVLLHARAAVLGAVEEAELHRVEALLDVLDGLALEFLHVDGVEVRRVGGNLVFGGAAEQFVHRLAGVLPGDVPQRLVDRADGHDRDALPAERERGAVHLFPEQFALHRVLANDDFRERLLDDGGDGTSAPVTDADAGDARVRLDLDDHVAHGAHPLAAGLRVLPVDVAVLVVLRHDGDEREFDELAPRLVADFRR